MIYYPNFMLDFLLSIFTIALIGGGGYFIFKARRGAKAGRTEEKEIVRQAKKTQGQISELSSVLGSLKKVKGKKANNAIMDAQVIAGQVVKSAIAFAERYDEYEKRAKMFASAAEAIAGNPRRLPIIAGQISSFDEEVSRLLLSGVPLRHEKFWARVMAMVLTQQGVYQRWADIYQEYSATLVNRVATEKTRIVMLTASGEFIEASKPVLQISERLEKAEKLLRLSSPLVRHKLTSVVPTNKI